MCADTTGPLAGITPENIINPPSCSGVDYIKNNRDQAVRETVNGLVDGLGKQCDAYFAWDALSTLSRTALENVYDGLDAPMAHQTRGCLIRRGLIETTAQAPTLWGREVVVEARRWGAICRRRRCLPGPIYPGQPYQGPVGCCPTKPGHDPGDCPCDCHDKQRRVTAPPATATKD